MHLQLPVPFGNAITLANPWESGDAVASLLTGKLTWNFADSVSIGFRRDCLDHVVVFGVRHLRYLLASYQRYYNEARTHLSLRKDSPVVPTANPKRLTATANQPILAPMSDLCRLIVVRRNAASRRLHPAPTPWTNRSPVPPPWTGRRFGLFTHERPLKFLR
jgi:hypothetical protein